MKRLFFAACAGLVVLSTAAAPALARKGDRGETYDHLSRPHKECHPELRNGQWVKVCRIVRR
jgi:hypothetical protein